ncbi:AAA ATPase [Bacillus cereus AH1271]|uniref:NB-ARC domain-containing protein n=1 Tax=Bacillus wiedmannii TaxID=1890302 RepID=UPI0001A1273E|nr:NB-ARC domain-containing protein [Bacillus wiedmannii]EEL83359.1 AAA ATPase [Bacillus cereus AH1271]PEJ53864.1 hypothetical protein CN672_00635 [Bacillus wiedmannii]PEM14606.1 hypothetical protein CN610_02550 [Bacillus wiedmannii]PHD11779.1 hypothetical protein COF45_11445 [Bacillus wiedmannii]
MYNSQAARLTLYAFISSIENDLRDFLNLNINKDNETEILSGFLDKVKRRTSPEDLDSTNLKAIVDFLDFGDLKQIIDKIIESLPNSFKKDLQSLSQKIELITPIRNRVMHSRPLQFEDFPTVIDFIETINQYNFINFHTTKETKEKIQSDPSYIYGIKLPNFNHKYDTILNNLPHPDFDDTGFVGRDTDRKEIKKLILGHYPVISVVGDGGIGKTALVLNTLYDLLDDPTQPFEGIIWISLKTRTLNNGEFINIKHSITSTVDIYKEIHHVLDSNSQNEDAESLISSIIEYMENFNILLVLDNLETINTEKIRSFFTRLPKNSKIITTSRIGIGEFEHRHPLKGLTEKESTYYLRRLAQNNKLDILSKINNKKLIEIASNLYYNPLAMKWFVANILKGESIESILKHKENLTEYCMSNVYSKLSSDAQKILETMLICNKECSNAELTYLINLDSIHYGKAMNDLFATNMVYMKNYHTNDGENRTLYFITDFAREYLKKHCRPTNKSFISINKKLRTLKGLSENLIEQTDNDPYQIQSIIITHPDEEISAFYLKKALTCSNKDEFSQAEEYIEKARNATPDYFEVYRVSASINVAKQDFFAAELDYQTALECKPNYAPILYFYSGFKLMFVENFEDAYDAIIKAETLDPASTLIKMTKGRILKQMSKFPEAKAVFQELLLKYESLSLRNKKFLIDQSSDNLRRWADKIRTEDPNQAEDLIRQAMDIMDNLDTTFFDTKLITTIMKTIKTLAYIYIDSNKKDVTYLIYLLNLYYSKIRVIEQQDFRRPFDLLSAKIPPSQRQEIDSIFSNKNIHSFQEEGFIFQLKDRYGFIKNFSPNNLFFYWQDFDGDFSSLSIGDRVTFTVEKNQKGLCAKKVKLT